MENHVGGTSHGTLRLGERLPRLVQPKTRDADNFATRPPPNRCFRMMTKTRMLYARAGATAIAAALALTSTPAVSQQATEPAEIQVRLYGKVAAVRYKARADVASRGNRLPTMETWNTGLYEQRQGRWLIVWFQVTQISPSPR